MAYEVWSLMRCDGISGVVSYDMCVSGLMHLLHHMCVSGLMHLLHHSHAMPPVLHAHTHTHTPLLHPLVPSRIFS